MTALPKQDPTSLSVSTGEAGIQPEGAQRSLKTEIQESHLPGLWEKWNLQIETFVFPSLAVAEGNCPQSDLESLDS